VASLTYDEAQVMLDSPAPADKVNHSVNLLNKLARILRQRRIDMGALTLASPEVRFKLDSETQNPTDVAMYSLKESNALVEEWMLLANITVSKQILKFYPTLGILRRHQPPSREQFAPLVSSALAVGVNLDISSSKTLADSLDRAVRPDDPYFNKLLRILSTRCMMPAQYFCSGEIPKDQWHHYGLAAPVYTHFTSPIRRYADVLVHRLLAATIGVIALPAANADRSRQQELCTHMNRRHRAAQYAQRGSVNLHTINYFRARPAAQEAAYVLTVKEDSFTVLVPRFGIEGTLRWEDIMAALDCDESEFDAAAHTMALSSRRAVVPVQSASKKQKKQATAGSAETKTVVLKLRVFDRVSISIKVDEGSGNGGDRKLVIGLVHEDKDLAEVLRSKPRKTGLAQDGAGSSKMQT
jgi:exosome complex exonuclease DIS3/RRP44